jgi:hypothetical protein
MDDDLESSVLVTGCQDEDKGVQIQSAVHGDWLFTAKNGQAFALVFDEDDFYYDDFLESDYYEEVFPDSYYFQ